MLFVFVSEKNESPKKITFEKDDISFGRVSGNDVVLPRSNVSKKHARIVERNGKMIILDLRSTNGTMVNGKRISAPQVVRFEDKIQIGNFLFQVSNQAREGQALEKKKSDLAAQKPVKVESRVVSRVDEFDELDEKEKPVVSTSTKKQPHVSSVQDVHKPKKRDPKVEQYAGLLREVHGRLIDYLDLRRMNIEQLGDEELWNQTEKAIRDILIQMEDDSEIPSWVDRERLVNDVLNEALGLGPLEDFLSDPNITEIMVNHSKQIYVEREGKIVLTPKTFSSNQAVMGVIERIVAPLGRRIDESSPMVDARLKDGSRVNAIIPPLSIKGPCLTIRKFSKEVLSINQLVKFGTLTPGMAEFLEMCVKARKNVVVSGGTGSGKTTTLNCLTAFIPETERIVTVEDSAELQIHQEHWVSLESRPPNIEGKGEVVIRDLVRNCLRMRPDRIVVGECRGGETLDMLQAMNTGHDGSLTTAHSNSPRDTLARLETMVMMSGMDLPLRAIREQVASAIDIIAHQTRFPDGTRKVTQISEITGMEADVITMQDIFFFRQQGFTKDNRIKGMFVASGFIPKFYDELQQRGIPVSMDIFREQ